MPRYIKKKYTSQFGVQYMMNCITNLHSKLIKREKQQQKNQSEIRLQIEGNIENDQL